MDLKLLFIIAAVKQVAKFIHIIFAQTILSAEHGYTVTIYFFVQKGHIGQNGSAAVRAFYIGLFRHKGKRNSTHGDKSFDIVFADAYRG